MFMFNCSCFCITTLTHIRCISLFSTFMMCTYVWSNKYFQYQYQYQLHICLPVIFNQLTTYLTINNILNSQQYGYHRNASTELAALELIDRISNLMDNGHTPINI